MDCYEDMFKEITKKLYGDESLAEVISAGEVVNAVGGGLPQNIVFDATDAFSLRTTLDGGQQVAHIVTTATTNGLPAGTAFVVQKRNQDDKGVPQSDHLLTVTTSSPNQGDQNQSILEERWFENEDLLSWTTSKIARFNPGQKVFRCVDCDFVGFLSRVAEHWLGNHASLRVFQCPRCPYTSAWARCVRMHLTKQHNESFTDNSLWKENPVLEEVTKYLNNLKTKVEQKAETSIPPGEKRYTCQYCPYATDRRDLFNRHENIHRETKPFECYICQKQFNRADHVKKHFMRMHKDAPYDINRIRKHLHKNQGGALPFFVGNNNINNNNNNNNTPSRKSSKNQQQQQQQQLQQQQQQLEEQQNNFLPNDSISVQLETPNGNQTVTLEQIPHIAFFNPPASTTGGVQSGPLQGIQGVGGTKKEAKVKEKKKKKSGEKMYTCSYCPWTGVDNWCLKRHLNTHIKPFLCALCDYKAARSERLATHVLKVHNKRVCHKCSYLADDSESLSQHVQDSHQNPLVKTGFNCNICQEYFELRADLEAHAILEHQKVIVQCDLCDFRTTDESSMESHLREKHNLQPGMGAVAAAAAAASLAVNGQQQQQRQQTLHHQQTATIQMPEPTQLQEKKPSQTELIIPDLNNYHHQQQQQQENLFHQQQQQHQEQIHQQQQQQVIQIQQQQMSSLDQTLQEISMIPEDLEEMEQDEDIIYYCDICGSEFNDDSSLKSHEKIHKGYLPKMSLEIPRSSKGVSRDYNCSLCSYTCPTRKLMIEHWRVHNGFLQECQLRGCHYTSPFSNSLKGHILIEHANDQVTIRCPHCGLKMTSIQCFTIHWRVHHEAICSLCVNLYKVKFSLKEPVIHEFVLRSTNQLNGVKNDDGPLTAPDDDDDNDEMDTSSVNTILPVNVNMNSNSNSNTTNDNDSNNNNGDGTSTSNNSNNVQEPPAKKQRLDNLLSLLPQDPSSLNQLIKRHSSCMTRDKIKFLPKLSEYTVTRYRGDKIIKKNSKNSTKVVKKFNKNQKNCELHLERNKLMRRIHRWGIRQRQRNIELEKYKLQGQINDYNPGTTTTTTTTSIISNCRSRKDSRKGSIVVNNYSNTGYKCLAPSCSDRGWRFVSKKNLILHQIRHHNNRNNSRNTSTRASTMIKCDICEDQFPNFYSSFIHKMRYHSESMEIGSPQPSLTDPDHQHLQQQHQKHMIFKSELS